MLFNYEQLRLINRVFPIEFIEDEFRLDPELTKERLHKRVSSIDDNDLKNTYYLIHVKYRNVFVDEDNVYLCLIYNMLKQVCEERNINLRKYLDGIKIARRSVDLYFLAGCIASALIFKKILVIHIIFAIIGLGILYKWDAISLFIAKKLKKKVLHVQQYVELPRMMTITSIICIIFTLRAYDSVLFLVCIYAFLLFCHIRSVRFLERDVIPDIKKLTTNIAIRAYEVIMAGLIIWCLVNPVRDLLGEWFDTKSIKYIEGICSEVEDKMFDYKLATIDGYKVMISTLNHDVKVGDYYRIEYGVHTKAVTYVGRKDIVSQFKDKETEEVTSAQEFLNQYENNKILEEKEKNKKKKKKSAASQEENVEEVKEVEETNETEEKVNEVSGDEEVSEK